MDNRLAVISDADGMVNLKRQAEAVYGRLAGNRTAETMIGACQLIALSIVGEVAPGGHLAYGDIWRWDGNPDSAAYVRKHWWVETADGSVLDPMGDALGVTGRRTLPVPPERVAMLGMLSDRLVREAGSRERAVACLVAAADMVRLGLGYVIKQR